MKTKIQLGTWGICLSLIATVCFGLAYGVGPASANGGTRPLVINAQSGPYEIQVGIFPGRPKVGNLHLSILVKDATAGSTITDATIMVGARGPTGAAGVPPVQAINTPQSPQFYDADIQLDTVGSWTLTVETGAGLGKASLDVPFEVTESEGIDIVFVLAGGVALVALSLWLLDRIGRRRKRRSSNS